jgi:hypothetical protein
MAKKSYLFGTPRTYPYHFVAKRGKGDTFYSGAFKKKSVAQERANELREKGYSVRVKDRRKKK